MKITFIIRVTILKAIYQIIKYDTLSMSTPNSNLDNPFTTLATEPKIVKKRSSFIFVSPYYL